MSRFKKVLAVFIPLCPTTISLLAAIAIVYLPAVLNFSQPAQALDGRNGKSGELYSLVLGPASKHQRTLTFPSAYSLGELFVRSYGPGVTDDGIREPAKGKVIVPPGKLVHFIPGPNFYKNPSIIKTLPADGFDVVEFAASSLDDSEDGLCDRALAYVGRLKGMIELKLDRSDATDAGAVHAAELPDLQKITGLSAGLEGKCFKQFSALKHLRYIYLPRNCLKDENIQYLAGIPNLQYLNVGFCNLSDAAVKDLARCPNLISLNISNNPKITDQSIKYLLTMKKLSCLSLQKTSFSAHAIMQLKDLPLKSLQLSDNHYTAAQINGMRKAMPAVSISVHAQKKSVDSDTDAIFAPLH